MKYCKDCKHIKCGEKAYECTLASYTGIDSKAYFTSCKGSRFSASMCGEVAMWFEPKPTLIARFIQFFSKS